MSKLYLYNRLLWRNFKVTCKNTKVICLTIVFVIAMIGTNFFFISAELSPAGLYSLTSPYLLTFFIKILACFILTMIVSIYLFSEQKKLGYHVVEVRAGIAELWSYYMRILISIIYGWALVSFTILFSFFFLIGSNDIKFLISLIIFPNISFYFFFPFFTLFNLVFAIYFKEVIATLLSALIGVFMSVNFLINIYTVMTEKSNVSLNEIQVVNSIEDKYKVSNESFNFFKEKIKEEKFLKILNDNVELFNSIKFGHSILNYDYSFENFFQRSSDILSTFREQFYTGRIYYFTTSDKIINILNKTYIGSQINELIKLVENNESNFEKIDFDNTRIDYYWSDKSNQKGKITKYNFDNFISKLILVANNEQQEIIRFVQKVYKNYWFQTQHTNGFLTRNDSLVRKELNTEDTWDNYYLLASNNISDDQIKKVNDYNLKLQELYKNYPGLSIMNNILINVMRNIYYNGVEINLGDTYEPVTELSYQTITNKMKMNNQLFLQSHLLLIYSNSFSTNKYVEKLLTKTSAYFPTTSVNFEGDVNSKWQDSQNEESFWDENDLVIKNNFNVYLAVFVYSMLTGLLSVAIFLGNKKILRKKDN